MPFASYFQAKGKDKDEQAVTRVKSSRAASLAASAAPTPRRLSINGSYQGGSIRGPTVMVAAGGGGKDDDLPDTVVAFDEGRGTMAAASQWLRIDAMLGCFDEVLEEIRQLKKAIKTMKQS